MRTLGRSALALLPCIASIIAFPQSGLAGTFQGPSAEILRQFVTTAHGVDSVPADSQRLFFRAWDFALVNKVSGRSLTEPTITVNSDYNSHRFLDVSSFPVTLTQASLPPGGNGLFATFMILRLTSRVPEHATLGFDSNRDAAPLSVPSGGGEQTLTITVIIRDLRYTEAVSSGHITVTVPMDVPGETGTCGTTTAPGPWFDCHVDPGTGTVYWNSCGTGCGNDVLNVPIIFTVNLSVPNTSSQAIAHNPPVAVEVYGGGDCGQPNRAGPTSSVTVMEPSLDGRTPGSGSATFSIVETDLVWEVGACLDTYRVSYE